RQTCAQAVAMGTLWNNFVRPPATAAEARLQQLDEERRAAAERAAQMRAGGKRPAVPDRPEEPPPAKPYDPARLVHAAKAATAEDAVRVLVDVYLPGGVRESARARLVAFVAEGKPAGAAF